MREIYYVATFDDLPSPKSLGEKFYVADEDTVYYDFGFPNNAYHQYVPVNMMTCGGEVVSLAGDGRNIAALLRGKCTLIPWVKSC